MNDIFSNYIKTENITFKHARGVSDKTGKEFHVYHEIILFLDGDAEFISEDMHVRLKPETLIIIPKESYHQLVVHGDKENYCRCVLHLNDSGKLSKLVIRCMKKVIFIRADDEIKYLFNKLCVYSADPTDGRELILQAAATFLLDLIPAKNNIAIKEHFRNDIIKCAIEYINDNIGKELSVCNIAAKCNVSCSTMSHIFKQEMNIPLHRFILKKRLIQAYHQISLGKPATAVALECGFKDYSGFYKQYKKTFGCSPSQKI